LFRPVPLLFRLGIRIFTKINAQRMKTIPSLLRTAAAAALLFPLCVPLSAQKKSVEIVKTELVCHLTDWKTEDQVFKYYYFFNAYDEAQFDDWYENIMSLAEYDTGVTAEYGDEFITLSTCSYHVEDGRFVVVGKRIK